ncbi:MAG TPA: type II toxin-antitoxin system VapB family antitoxin [Thermoanaerobaculia bacterium]
MKQISVDVDEALLEKARELSGEHEDQVLIARALEALVRYETAMQIFKYQGTGIWEGDLAEMREDSPRRPGKRSGSR